eukprot:gene18716-biopygen5441
MVMPVISGGLGAAQAPKAPGVSRDRARPRPAAGRGGHPELTVRRNPPPCPSRSPLAEWTPFWRRPAVAAAPRGPSARSPHPLGEIRPRPGSSAARGGLHADKAP